MSDLYKEVKPYSGIKIFLLALGVFLILMGVCLLLYFVSYIIQILEHPQDVALFSYLESFFPDTEDGAIFFEFHGAAERDYLRGEFSKSFGLLGAMFFIIIGLAVFGGIIRLFIFGGIKMIVPIVFPEYAKNHKDKPFFKHNNRDYAERL